jgi:5-methylcytosine-specific restriction protein A
VAAITHREIAATYAVARLREDKALTEAQTISRLTVEFGMNRSSANDYIDAYRHMRAGQVFKRTIKADAASYFLHSILSDFGHDSAVLALRALWLHIEYYEPVRGIRYGSMRRVGEEFSAKLPLQPDELLIIQQSLAIEVLELMAAPAQFRTAKLPGAGHKPRSISVTTNVYVRSPAVIAEVLLRADGICEMCKKPASFLRRSDQSPYLEVHHRQRLADGGDDTVENALAICPNCHRQSHFG